MKLLKSRTTGTTHLFADGETLSLCGRLYFHDVRPDDRHYKICRTCEKAAAAREKRKKE